MDRQTINHKDTKDTGLLFLQLKPRLLKCTTFSTEKRNDRKNDLRVELAQLPTSALTRIRGQGRGY